jgi:hypothetical protein
MRIRTLDEAMLNSRFSYESVERPETIYGERIVCSFGARSLPSRIYGNYPAFMMSLSTPKLPDQFCSDRYKIDSRAIQEVLHERIVLDLRELHP